MGNTQTIVIGRDALEGKGAVITGANEGIGAAITKKLLEYGMVVIGIDKETDNLDELKQSSIGETLYIYQANICDEEEVLDAFQWISDNLETVDVLINAADVAEKSSILDGDVEQWKQMANTNIVGLCMCTSEIIRTMKDTKLDLGHIIHVNSIAGEKVGLNDDYHFYSATKHAVTALATGLKKELEISNNQIKITNIVIGPHELFAKEDGYKSLSYEAKGYLEMDDITEAIEYIIHTPSHVQVQDLRIVTK